MNLIFHFYKQVSQVSTEFVFDLFLTRFKEKNPEITVTWNNISIPENKSMFSYIPPVCGIIECVETKKILVISYWDRCQDFCNNFTLKDIKVSEIITSSGLHEKKLENCKDIKITPFSYLCYNSNFEYHSKSNRLHFNDKKNKNLFFRGLLYGFRKKLYEVKPEIFVFEKLNHIDYFNELNSSKICLSLNGAGLICHRDIEILSTGSVLFRPKFEFNFHNSLVPFVHYIPFEETENPKDQMDIILDTYEKYRYDNSLLEYVSNNGLKWYLENGTTDKNIEILLNIITKDNFI